MNLERDNLIAERNFLRRCVFESEIHLRTAAGFMRQAGCEPEALEFERNAARTKAVRMIVTSI